MLALCACHTGPTVPLDTIAQRDDSVLLRLRDGRKLEATLRTRAITIRSALGVTRELEPAEILSIQTGTPASAVEADWITRDLTQLDSGDGRARDEAEVELLEIGIPVLTPLLSGFADRDGREPDPRLRLFRRLLPSGADDIDRTLELIRLADGSCVRGKLVTPKLWLATASEPELIIPAEEIRSLAMRRAHIRKVFELDALRDCTYVSFLDTGVVLGEREATLTSHAEGLVRLSFDEDGWAADPDGIREPLPGKRKLQEGFRWGSVLCRVGVTGERWFAGRHMVRAASGPGHVYFVVNDNEHWQNNVGNFRVVLDVDGAYDLGDPR